MKKDKEVLFMGAEIYSRPWYDDRTTTLWDPENPFGPPAWSESIDSPAPRQDDPAEHWPPKRIYEYLNGRVWKQDAAKRAAAMLVYNTLGRGIKENAFFVGPTGCGKSHIWRCLQELYPKRIAIVDASRLTKDGWQGGTKWPDLLRNSIFHTGQPAILVMDESDKFLIPKHNAEGDNVAQSVAGEGLKILEGTQVEIKGKGQAVVVDTTHISFVCCGAFSVKADQLAQSRRQPMGFGGSLVPSAAYDQPLTENDLLDCGVMPEFLGRFQRVVNLAPMTADDFYRMMDSPCGPVSRLQKHYGVEIRLTERKRRELADLAAETGLGVRGMENQLRQLLDDALFADHTQNTLAF